MTSSNTPRLSKDRPFPGLRPFEFQDYEYFFGREDQIFSLYRLLDRSRFIAVVGGSGSGKSSLVRAGLLPLIVQESEDIGGHTWSVATMHPGDAPLSALTEALSTLSEGDDEIVARIALHLGDSSAGLANALSEIKLPASRTLILVVDQFEELFRYGNFDQSQAHGLRDEAADFVRLLLEASRSRTHRVHVLLTMRSDFIGECARFQGLPEAVSATQFLVPSLTRDQLEEVIVKPIEKAGSTIDPDLVERLLNDSGNDLDQLPVLQHCLLRLWEEAGKSGAKSEDGPALVPDSDSAANGSPAPRHLTERHYDAVGGISGALSKHAEEILSSLPALKRVVEQVFRALSEVDRQGRGIRRPLPYSQLCDETGEADDDVRQVVDRFRADDCSFLVPSISSVPKLEPDTRTDIGHEALLRRWERVSRKLDPVQREDARSFARRAYRALLGWMRGGESTVAQRRAEDGWLQAEESDGQLYRALRSRDARDLLPRGKAEEYSSWWYERPRTPAWADRYGGELNKVVQLIKGSVTRKRRAVLITTVVVAATIAFVGFEFLWLYSTYQDKERATQNFRLAVGSAQKLLDQVSTSLDRGEISVQGAKALLQTAGNILNAVQQVSKPETSHLNTKLLQTTSDIRMMTGEVQQAYDVAQRAKESAKQLLIAEPDNQAMLQDVYNSSWRAADALDEGAVPANPQQTALVEYMNALALAERLAGMAPDNRDRQRQVMFILHKIGDVHQVQKNWEGATAQYSRALKIMQEVNDAEPNNPNWQRELATCWSRLGQASIGKKEYGQALVHYRTAFDIRSKLAIADPHDDVIQSNLSRSHVELGQAQEKLEQLDAALADYRSALAIRKRLALKDPGNPTWSGYLASAYGYVGTILKRQGNLVDALAQYKPALELRRALAARDPTKSRQDSWVRASTTVVELSTSVAALFAAENQPGAAVEAYHDAIDVLQELVPVRPNELGYPREIFLNRIKAGDVLNTKSDVKGALQEYGLALIVAHQHADTNPSDVAWRGNLASAHMKVADVLSSQGDSTKALEHYQSALAILENLAPSDLKKFADGSDMLQEVRTKIEKVAAKP
jgi:tetratricopeptide (TPR) repeat protein